MAALTDHPETNWFTRHLPVVDFPPLIVAAGILAAESGGANQSALEWILNAVIGAAVGGPLLWLMLNFIAALPTIWLRFHGGQTIEEEMKRYMDNPLRPVVTLGVLAAYLAGAHHWL